MFLDDELLKIARNADLSSEAGINEACSEMIKVAFGSIEKNTSELISGIIG